MIIIDYELLFNLCVIMLPLILVLEMLIQDKVSSKVEIIYLICGFLLFFISLLALVKDNYPAQYSYKENVSKARYIEEAVLLREGSVYYVIQPNGIKEEVSKIERKDNQLDYLARDDDETVYIINVIDDRKFSSLFTIRDKVNILYVSDELFDVLNQKNPPVTIELGEYIRRSN